MCAAVLGLEGIAVGLVTPVLVNLTDLSLGIALSLGLGLAVACFVLAGLLRSEWAYWAAYALQVAVLGLALVVPMMLVLGLIFSGLWIAADQLGRSIERDRAAAYAAYDARQ